MYILKKVYHYVQINLEGELRMEKISGVCPPVITIFDKDGKIDIAANKKHAEFLIRKGVDGLVYLGTSGEFSVLTLNEKKEFIKEMYHYVDGRVKIIVGVGDTCRENTLELLKFIEKLGVDAILLINPYFSIYDESMVESYYDSIVGETELPVIIYNFPGLTGFNFSVDLVKRLLSKHCNIHGIKDTIENITHMRNMVKMREINPNFTTFCAYEEQALAVLAMGIDGFINATANFAPEFTVEIYKAYQEKDFKKAMEYQQKLSNATKIYNYSSPLFLACKQAVYHRVIGYDGGERLPALSLSKQKKDAILKELQELKLL